MSHRLHQAIYGLLLLVLAAMVSSSFVSSSQSHAGINEYERSLFLDMVEGDAHRPFVYRTLLPTTVRGVSAVVPEAATSALEKQVQKHQWLQRIFRELQWETHAADRYLIAIVLMYLCFVGFGHVTVRLTERVLDLEVSLATRIRLIVALFIALPSFFRYTSYLYDPPQLFLFALALLLIHEGRTRLFFLVFVACCLNKETAIVLIPLFALTCRDRFASRKSFAGAVVALGLLFVAVKLTLVWAFADNPGSFVETHVELNLRRVLRYWEFPDVFAFLGLSYLVSFDWRAKPHFLKVALLCTLPPLLFLAIFFGLIDEWRIFYEVVPVAFVCIADSIRRIDQRLRT